MFTRIWFQLVFACVVFCYVNSYSDGEFCHPHCLVTCLPSCQCCDSHAEMTEETLLKNKRNQLKLEKLEQILRDKDLEVGIVCRPSCKHKCLPSCKFECCRDHHLAKKKDHAAVGGLNVGFDLRKLLKSMEETQREYKKLKAFIRKVNTSVTSLKKHHTPSNISEHLLHAEQPNYLHAINKSNQNLTYYPHTYIAELVNKQTPHKALIHFNLDPSSSKGAGTEVDIPSKHKMKSNMKVTRKKENMELLQQLYDIQDRLDEKERIKEKVKARLLDSPYTKLLTSQQRLKVELVDGPELQLHPKQINSLKKYSKTNTIKVKEVSKNKEIRNYYHHDSTDQKKCDVECKEFCAETCNFECCEVKSEIPSNSSDSSMSPGNGTISDSNGQDNNKTLDVNNTTLTDQSKIADMNMPISLSQNATGLINGLNETNISSTDAKELLETKHQLEKLLGVLSEAKSKHFHNSSIITTDVCNVKCKTDCSPDCPFKCC